MWLSGSKKLEPEVIENATRFFAELPPKYRSVFVPDENLSATPHGTVTFDWCVRKNFVSVEIGRTLMGFFSDLYSGRNYTSDGCKIGNEPSLMLTFHELYGF